MNFFRSIIMCFSTFSKIPMPQIEWRSENMRFMMAAFPLIGAVIGALLLGWNALAAYLGFGVFLRGAGFLLIALIVTGCIHMDGFCDVCDALSSHAAPEKMRQILKDPHVGAFAVLSSAVYLIGYVAFTTEIPENWQAVGLLALAPVLSRSLSACSVIAFPKSTNEGMLASFQVSAEKRPALVACIIFAIAAIAGMIAIHLIAGIVMAVVALLCLAWLKVLSAKKFGGMSGDLAGWFLQMAELGMLIALVVVFKVVA